MASGQIAEDGQNDLKSDDVEQFYGTIRYAGQPRKLGEGGEVDLVENLAPSVAILLLPSVWSVCAVVDVHVTTCMHTINIVKTI